MRTVVSGGSTMSTSGMSLWPTTETSSGQARPAGCKLLVGAERQEIVCGDDGGELGPVQELGCGGPAGLARVGLGGRHG